VSINYILFGEGVALLICSALQLTTRDRTRVNSLMAALFALLGYLVLYPWLHRMGITSEFPVLIATDLLATVLIGPVAYSYFKSVFGYAGSTPGPRKTELLPALGVLVLFLFYRPSGMNAATVSRAHYPTYSSDPVVYAVTVAADVWMAGYFIVTVWRLVRIRRVERPHAVGEIRFVFWFFVAVLVSCLLLFVAHSMRNDLLIAIVSTIGATLGIVYFLFSYRYPEYTQRRIRTKRSRTPVEHEEVSNSQSNADLRRLHLLVEVEGAYRDPELTLQSLSIALDMSGHQLSRLLNRELGMNLRSYINSHRLREAKRLLREEPLRPILDIAFAVGFNSKTTFNTAFMKETGMSPSRYRKNSADTGERSVPD
jgi:AraC-like DNA-binding protein